MASKVGAFVRLTRPHFLLGGVLMHLVGVAAAGRFSWARFMLAQLLVTSIQLTAHYVNELYDADIDRSVAHRTWFSGGSGVLPAGTLSSALARRAAISSSAVAAATMVVFGAVAPWVVVVGIAALAGSVAYSAPPARLLDTGWGEVIACVIVVGLVPLVGSLAQGVGPAEALAWAVAPLVPLHLAMMLAFELPDLSTDATAGKTVLAVRLGRTPTRLVQVVLVALAVAAILVAVAVGALRSGAIAWLVPSGIAALVMIGAPERVANVATAAAVASFVLAGLAVVAGLGGL